MIIIINHYSQFKSTLLLASLALVVLSGCSSGNENQYQQQYNQAPQRQNYYAPQQQRQNYTNSPYNYQQPDSRRYSNPYAMPPQNQYPYYDGDQYYVPPTYYGVPNVDNPSNPSFNQKF